MSENNDEDIEILKENIKLLNKKFCSLNLKFILSDDRIIIDEEKVIKNNPGLKGYLKRKFSIEYDWSSYKWYIGKAGMKILSKEIVKIMPSKSIEELIEELDAYINLIKEESLRDSIMRLLSANDPFYSVPGAQYMHHAYEAGLLEHTVQTVRIALAIRNAIPDLPIDEDLLISGAILHDIGKINCYEFHDGIIEITDIFKEQEHIINGIKIISREIESKKLDDLIHIIASHHNIKDWGSPIEPQSYEAWIVHVAENLSSKIMG